MKSGNIRRSSALYFIMEVTPPNASAEWHPTCWAGRPQQDAQREAPSGSDIGPSEAQRRQSRSVCRTSAILPGFQSRMGGPISFETKNDSKGT